MAVNVALQLEQIIGAPLKALVEAQRLSTMAMFDFIMSLAKRDQDRLTLESIDIVYQRMIHDPQQGVKIEKQTINVPLLTLVPVPYISIDEGEISFNLKIVSVAESSQSVMGAPYRLVNIYAVFGSGSRSDLGVSSEMSFRIRIKRGEMPEGLARTLSIVSDGITIKSG